MRPGVSPRLWRGILIGILLEAVGIVGVWVLLVLVMTALDSPCR